MSAAASSSSAGTVPSSHASSAPLTIPSPAVAHVIGRGGATLNALKATAGIRTIELKQVNKDNREAGSVATITGEPHAVESVRAAIRKIISRCVAQRSQACPQSVPPPSTLAAASPASAAASSSSSSSPPSADVTEILTVPSCAVGLLIGAQGTSLRAWQCTPGITDVSIESATRNPNHGSLVTVVGAKEDVAWVLKQMRTVCASAQRSLANGSRQLHSNQHKFGRPDSFLRNAAEVHKKPNRPLGAWAIEQQRQKTHQKNLDSKYEREHRDQQ